MSHKVTQPSGGQSGKQGREVGLESTRWLAREAEGAEGGRWSGLCESLQSLGFGMSLVE